jgi:hypothetical protein
MTMKSPANSSCTPSTVGCFRFALIESNSCGGGATRLALAALCVACLLFFPPSAKADGRVAFIVGNGAYKNVAQLPNPPIDARAMAALLRNTGFDVVEGYDLGRDAMNAKLREFAVKTQGADIAVFFYAGHGIAVNGKNYLIPVDADLKSEMDIKLGAAFDAEVTLDQTMSDAKVKLVLLDACRDNPFAARVRSASRTRSVVVGSGLAEMKSGEGTLIAFATSPGQTALDGDNGGNSPFTKALLANIAAPGVEIQQAMTMVRAQVNDETHKQQLPWGHTNLIGTVYLNPAAAAPGATIVANADATATPGTSTAVASEVELEFWRSIKDSNKPEELNAYLLKYPNGQFKSIATARLAALQTHGASQTTAAPAMAPIDPALTSTESSAATEDVLSLDRNEVKVIQRRLTALGFDASDSGKFTDDTRKAITRWQTARGYYQSGYLNRLQHQALLKEGAAATATRAVTPRSDRAAAPRQYRGTGNDSAPAKAGAFIGNAVGGILGGAFGRR